MKEKILSYLRSAEGYISGEDISRRLKISRTAIWKNIEDLRRLGYDIAAVPHLGYQLVKNPDKLFSQEIQNGLSTQTLGRKIVHYETIDSTMTEAFQLGMSGEDEGVVVCAETQSKGKGRMGRAWVSPPGKGIYMSVVLRPQISPADAAKLTLVAAVAMCEALNTFADGQVQIKWPNDLLVDGKKLGGILTELSAEMDRIRFVVIGVGVNVNSSKSLLPENSTSLKMITGKTHSRVAVVQQMLVSLEKWYGIYLEEGFFQVSETWKASSATLGQRVKVVDHGNEVEGEAVDLDENGGLVIAHESGRLIRRMSGDVIAL